jgi:dTDP-4-dehydrorhamnose reductase
MTIPRRMAPPPLEMWAGVECTVNRVGDRWFDQLAWSGHDRRPDDLDRFAAMGITAIRYPVLWERHAPHSLDAIDWQWSDERLARLRSLGLRPIVGLLHHGSGPRYTSLVDEAFPRQLARFARAVAERYPWVTDFTPINEPLTTARFSALYGHWYPHATSNAAFVAALLSQCRAIGQAMRAIRDVTPGARLVQTEDCGETFGTPATGRQVDFEAHRRWLTTDLLTGAVTPEHPLWGTLLHWGANADHLRALAAAPCHPDIVGLNYYLTSDRFLDDRTERFPEFLRGGNGELAYADVEAVRARPEGIVGHEQHLVAAWERYRIPVALTEVHLGCTREDQMRWLVEAWRGAQRARSRGVDVRGVTAWALLGSYNWDSLVTRDDDHYEPGVYDLRAPSPRPTALATVARGLVADAKDHPVIAGAGWWRRPDRMTFGGVPVLHGVAPPDAAPIVIIGATGTLGPAFHHICRLRGVASQLASRQTVDIADPTSVDAMLRRLRPWAVINAAGYVRVDDAEGDEEACRRANVLGPVNLAAACRRRGLPLVTFSSDLVFDGLARRPYTEADVPSPLNVYGASKADAERRVGALLPGALIIRTSAFFGPWDEHNFLAGVFRRLDEGGSVTADVDSIVSPTYVPDLVHATLDLLIDGEQGLWHLANGGATSWYDFAVQAAALSGRTVERIRPARAADVWGAARRPAYSALTSARATLMQPLHQALAAFIEARASTPERRGAGAACASGWPPL